MAKSSSKSKPAPARKTAPKATARTVNGARGALGAKKALSGAKAGKAAAPTKAAGGAAKAARGTAKPPSDRRSGVTGRSVVTRPAQGREKAGVGSQGEVKAMRPQPRNMPTTAQAPGPIVQAVPTREPPRKNRAGLSMRELEHFRQLLLEKRREILGDVAAMEREALRSSGGTNLSNLPIHMADMGTDNYEQEFTLGLVEKDRTLIREINAALAKIQDGTYGICEGTGNPISKVRLEAQPWARFSIEHARKMERRIR